MQYLFCDLFSLATATAAKSLQSCPTLCNPIDGSPPGSAVPGILQARTLEWVAIPSPVHKSESEVPQSCPTLSDPMDRSLPGSSVHGFSRQEYWSGCHCVLLLQCIHLMYYKYLRVPTPALFHLFFCIVDGS